MTLSTFAKVQQIQKNLKSQLFVTMGHDKNAVRDAKNKADGLVLTHRWVHVLPEYVKNNIKYWRIGVQNPTR
jgi:hypothetical protein